MKQDYRKLTLDMQRRAAEMARVIQRDVPAYIAVAWERMKDANFSAQGFVRGGSAAPRWDKRKKETPRTSGKRILHATGTLQASVHFTPGAGQVRAWVDLGKIPYARIHNEGGRVSQYLGISPDIFVSAHKDIAYAIRRALNTH